MKLEYLVKHLILVSFLLLLLGCNNSSSAIKSATWLDQLNAADSAAKNIDHRAYLWQVVASPVVQSQDSTPSALRVVFLYRQDSGKRLKISFDDTNIESTIEVDQSGEIPIDRTTDQKHKRNEDIKTVQISSAQALARTIEDGRLFSNQHASTVNPIIGLYLSDDVPQQFHVPSAWKVTFIASGKNLNIWLDAHNGNIIMRSEELN